MAKNSISIKVTGLKQVNSYLKKSKGNVSAGVKSGLNQATIFLEGEVKQSIAGHKAEPRSVDTGRFLDSVSSNVTNFNGYVFSNVSYAKFLEYGTSRLTPRPHFKNSLMRNKTKINDYLQKKIKNKL